MKFKVNGVLKNISYAFSANAISTILSIFLVMIVPKLIGMEDYSYWQLYTFYTSYVGFFHFGMIDGIYLRYGGKKYNELNKPLFSSQFWILSIFQTIVGLLVVVFAILFVEDQNKKLVLFFTGLCCLIVNTRMMFQFVLQFTGRIGIYSRNLIIEKITYVLLVVVFIAVGFRRYEYLVFADIFAKIMTLFTICYACKDIVLAKMVNIRIGIKEAIINCRVGINLLFSNIASMLIIGVVRFSIERQWGVIEFGKISFALTVSNLIMVFINAVGVVVFPIIKRTTNENLPKIYSMLSTSLMICTFGVLVFYYPAKVILSLWLPKYAESLRYMALMFPICIYASKMGMLIDSYLKALRKEKLMLRINVVSTILSLVASLITVFLVKNLELAAVSIVILLAFRCIVAELVLSKFIKIRIKKDIVYELALTMIFITANWFINSWLAMLVYATAYVGYIVVNSANIKREIKNLKGYLR